MAKRNEGESAGDQCAPTTFAVLATVISSAPQQNGRPGRAVTNGTAIRHRSADGNRPPQEWDDPTRDIRDIRGTICVMPGSERRRANSMTGSLSCYIDNPHEITYHSFNKSLYRRDNT